MKQNSTPSVYAFLLRGAAAGMVFMALLVALLCQGCAGEKRKIVSEKQNTTGYGTQRKRSPDENKKLNEYYNNVQHQGQKRVGDAN